jgi:hypothetical protein
MRQGKAQASEAEKRKMATVLSDIAPATTMIISMVNC